MKNKLTATPSKSQEPNFLSKLEGINHASRPPKLLRRRIESLKKRQSYKYLGDKFSSGELKGSICKSVNRPDGKCIRGKNGSMLVEFNGKKTVVVARLLRKVEVVD